jgi:hypothetical protein
VLIGASTRARPCSSWSFLASAWPRIQLPPAELCQVAGLSDCVVHCSCGPAFSSGLEPLERTPEPSPNRSCAWDEQSSSWARAGRKPAAGVQTRGAGWLAEVPAGSTKCEDVRAQLACRGVSRGTSDACQQLNPQPGAWIPTWADGPSARGDRCTRADKQDSFVPKLSRKVRQRPF